MDKKGIIFLSVAILLIAGVIGFSSTSGFKNLRSEFIWVDNGDGTGYWGDAEQNSQQNQAPEISNNNPPNSTTTDDSEPKTDEQIADEEAQKTYEDAQKALDNKINTLNDMIKVVGDHITTYDACLVGISPDPTKDLNAIQQAYRDLNTANTNLKNYTGKVGTVTVSFSNQGVERDALIKKMPAGSPVTATSSLAVNNARIAANNVTIAKSSTPASTKSLLLTENANINRINTLNAQLSSLSKTAGYISLQNTVKSRQITVDKLVGSDHSIEKDLIARKAKLDALPKCQSDFVEWWNVFSKDQDSWEKNLFTYTDFIIPRAYAGASDVSIDFGAVRAIVGALFSRATERRNDLVKQKDDMYKNKPETKTDKCIKEKGSGTKYDFKKQECVPEESINSECENYINSIDSVPSVRSFDQNITCSTAYHSCLDSAFQDSKDRLGRLETLCKIGNSFDKGYKKDSHLLSGALSLCKESYNECKKTRVNDPEYSKK